MTKEEFLMRAVLEAIRAQVNFKDDKDAVGWALSIYDEIKVQAGEHYRIERNEQNERLRKAFDAAISEPADSEAWNVSACEMLNNIVESM